MNLQTISEVTEKKIRIKVKQKSILALLDSGAKCSVIKADTARSLGLKFKMEKETPKSLFGANGGKLQILGEITVEINIQGLLLPVTLIVLEDLVHKIILGQDFLRENRGVLDIAGRTVSFYDETITVPMIEPGNDFRFFVRSHIAAVIPPRCEAIISGDIDSNYRRPTISLLEPYAGLKSKNLLLARSVVSTRQGQVACRIANPTNEGIFIPRCSKLACIEPVKVIKKRRGQDDILPLGHVSNKKTGKIQTAEEIIADIGLKVDKSQLTPENYEIMINFLAENQDIFAKSLADLKIIPGIEHTIDVGDAQPVRRRPYPVSPENRREIERQVTELLDLGMVTNSTSPWSAPVLLVKKADGSSRMVVDYRQLNLKTKKTYAYMTTFDQVTESLAEVMPDTYTTLDCRSGYNQLKVKDTDRAKTAFDVPGIGHLEWVVTPQGLCGAPVTFSQAMSIILRGVQFKYCLAYLDDIIVFSRGMEEHLKNLQEIFQRCRENNLMLHPGKCTWGLSKTKFLGHVVSKDGIHCEESKVKAVENFPRPHNVKTTRGFIGICSFYRKYIYRFADICGPLYDLLKKDQKFSWGDKEEKAFQTLKQKLISAPVLAMPDLSKPFILATDASDRACSFVLEQRDAENKIHPICFGARSFRKEELKYSTHERECIGILSGIKQYDHYLSGKPFIIMTDNISLTYLQSLKNTHGRLLRWAMFLQNYSYSIEHISGPKNTVPDALSRVDYEQESGEEDVEKYFEDKILTISSQDVRAEGKQLQKITRLFTLIQEDNGGRETKEGQPISIEEDSGVNPVEAEDTNQSSHHLQGTEDEEEALDELPNTQEYMTSTRIRMEDKEDIVALQRTDAEFKDMILFLEEGILPEDEKQARKIILSADQFTILEGRLYHLYQPRNQTVSKVYPIIQQLCIPEAIRSELLHSYHTSNLHLGSSRLFQTIRHQYWWGTLYRDCYLTATDCLDCQKAKDYARKKAPMHSLPLLKVGERIHFDLIGKLPKSKPDGYSHILLVIEHISRWVTLYPLRTQKASEICDNLMSWISDHGIPREMISDAAANLTGEVMTHLAKLLNIKQVKTAVYRQQANGVSERCNASVLLAFRLHLKDQTQWPTLLSTIQMSMRSTVSETTGFSPFEILRGHKMKHDIDWAYAQKLTQKTDIDDYVKSLAERIELIKEAATNSTDKNQARNKKYYDQGTVEPKFKIGDMVMMKNRTKRLKEARKFYPRFVGPLFIVGIVGKNSYKLRFVESEKLLKNLVCGDHLKMYVDTENKPYLTENDKSHRRIPKFEAMQPVRRPETILNENNQIQRQQLGQNQQQQTQDNFQNQDQNDPQRQTQEGTQKNIQSQDQQQQTLEQEYVPIKRILKRRNQKYLVEFMDNGLEWKHASEISNSAKADFYGKPVDRKLRSHKTWGLPCISY